MPSQKSIASLLLPMLTLACLATGAIGGLALGVYDIALASIYVEALQPVEFPGLR